MSRSAVLLMAYGAPRELSEIPAYLQDIRGGRPVSAELVREITRRYESIGGRSPLLDITRKQAEALEALLGKEGEFGVYIGMRHSEPGIASAVEALLADGHRSVLALPLTPYQSRMSTGAYLERLTQAVAAKGVELDIRTPAPWNEDASLVSAFAGKVRAALERRPKAAVLFTAHSLPESILREGDPYAEQLLATARAVAAEAGVSSWRLAYQSRPVSSGSGPAEPWLGPDAGRNSRSWPPPAPRPWCSRPSASSATISRRSTTRTSSTAARPRDSAWPTSAPLPSTTIPSSSAPSLPSSVPD